MAKVGQGLPTGEQDPDELHRYYDTLPVRRGLYAWIANDTGHSKSRKISSRKGRRRIKKGNK